MINPVTFMIPAMLAAAEQELLEPFRAAGATSPDRAVPAAGDAGDARFQSLLRRGILVRAGPGRYYLDEAALQRGRRQGGPVLAAAAVVLAVTGFIALLALLLD
jgi:hypothetical protein